MHEYFHDQYAKLEESGKAQGKNSNGTVFMKGFLIGEQKEIRQLPAPWSSDSDCFNMVLPNILVNPTELGNWQGVVTETSEFAGIKSLWLSWPIRDLTFIRSFPELKDIAPLKDSISYLLDVRHNNISNIDEISPDISSFYIEDNPVADNIPEHIAEMNFVDKDFEVTS